VTIKVLRDCTVDVRPTADDAIARPDLFEQSFEYDVAIVGMGYVGLPTALSLHASGRSVLGLDIDLERLLAIEAGKPDQLDSDRQRLATAMGDASFQLSSRLDLVSGARHVLICVPTPVDEHLVPDLKPLMGACQAVVDHAAYGQTIVLTSTSYVGSTRDLLVRPLEDRGFQVGVEIFVAFSPERIDPGNTTHRQESVPRVYGGVTPACGVRVEALLSACASRVYAVSSPEAAELTKLYENTFRAVNIALANEFADISRELGVDPIEVTTAAATKPYGFMPFFPGPGVGGHCIPCDPHYLLWQLRRAPVATPLIDQAMTCVAQRPGQVVSRVREVLSEAGQGLRGASVAVVGVTYKPNVEDIRESPAVEIIDALWKAGANVMYVDPLVPSLRLAGGRLITAATDLDAIHTDLVLLHTRHSSMDLSWLRSHPLVLDATYRAHELPDRVIL